MDKKSLKVKMFLNFFETYKKCPGFQMTIKKLIKSVLGFTRQ